MKRKEKNQQSRQRIMDSALAEFAMRGYGASSVNTICAAQGISKGTLYHYFDTKDALYLACVEECFQRLTGYIETALVASCGTVEQQLESYFAVRMEFFRENPVYQPIFCEAVIAPPAPLYEAIQARKWAFDDLNIRLLRGILEPLTLRPQITIDDVVETFQQFQDFINSKYRAADMNDAQFEARDAKCRKALNILLYGVIAGKDDSHV